MEEIVKEVLAGKKGAASKFYKTYELAIRRYLLTKLPSHEDVEEITQDVFMSAMNSLPIYRGEASIKSWLLSIARHEVADYYRKRYVRKMVERTTPIFEDLLADLNTPELELKKRSLRARFMRAYKSLNNKHRDALSYRYELGMSVKQIAEEMKLSFKATESLIFRARKAMRLAYESSGE